MIPGDVVVVRDREGGTYEAVIRCHVAGNIWRFEWITGPNDTKQDVAVFEPDKADEWKVS